MAFLRALAASERHDFTAVTGDARKVIEPAVSAKTPDTMQSTAEALITRARAGLRLPPDAQPWTTIAPASVTRELRYWRSAALLAQGDAPRAEAEADAALGELDRRPSAEFEWRIAAIGSAAARRRGDSAKADTMAARARTALQAVRDEWKTDAVSYERRADLAEWKRLAGIS